ncbi:MAG: enoyl-CoA hydratase family protein [Alphaproteobacteria bacterium]|nr:enoyl-CoA hydratase family protein [Alphaproteobacteria bacterium]MBU6472528.1 enoyl-CoA hydratase family protein [Alphaproteobacteria bacterium]MDE2013063.1 enoyl-CoA hydratase family protein [Alphaproteobacteria bacterium]MDE2074177.1 enoyl-CoA hydratase family protein [Alphaproteobacteria bacterium]MDE2353099.1 enoyl-CoA hydratase family protein [Alphaproteobacteria bacterium]
MKTLKPDTFKPRHFLWSFEGGVAQVTLNRPERKNPLTFESYAELGEMFRALNSCPEVKALVLTGAGGNFCSGGDVFEIIEPLTRRDMAGLLAFTRLTGDLVKAMRGCPQPVLAAVDGVCVGAGAIMAMASDLRLGTARSKTAFLFTRVGLAGCDMGACAILPRIIGQGRASDLLYSGRAIGGEEAERWGFYNRLVAPEALLDAALDWARELAAGPTFAHGITKTQLNAEWNVGLETAIEMEAQAQAICMQTQDFRRAFEAFRDKQKPHFEGN